MKKVTAVLNEMEAWKKSLSFADDSGSDHNQFYFSAHGLKTVHSSIITNVQRYSSSFKR
jgi:hypothetical protein